MSASEPGPTQPPIPPPTPGSTLLPDVSASGAHTPDPDRVPWGRALPGGTKVGDYTIQAPLAAGGMGVVYLAQQAQPQRTVALKLVRPGLASARMLRRFELEAETLGRLQHPGIAQIYEAGTFDLGEGPQPFFAMEFVVGVPLTQYAKAKGLGTRERLELAAKIADAVQHAHQRGVVHRDLKPSNILVTDEGQPKILDFGVARLTDADTSATTLHTDIGALVGTLPYMSPEQASGDPAQIDTRSDVYALGVVIYELLVDRLPHEVGKKLAIEAARIIREDEPTRLSSINTALRGDVETIVGHALEKDKERRYQSASALAADIRRYLGDEPISARPASTWYQLAKFSKRNKGLVGGVAAAFAALAAGLALALWQADVAKREAARADDRALAAQTAEKAEKERADQLKKVSDFQAGMLAGIDTTKAGIDLMADVRERFVAALEKAGVPEAEQTMRVDALRQELVRVNATDAAAAMIDRTILRPAIKTIDERFKNDPATDASLRQALADLYRTIGLYDASLPLQESALATRRRVLGEEHPETLSSICNMGSLLKDQGKYSEAEPYYREALEKSRRVLGEEHPDTIGAINNMGALLQAQGSLGQAEPYYREALEKSRRVLGEEHRTTLYLINNIGTLLKYRGKLTEAEPYYREALEKFRRVLGEEHPDTLSAVGNIGVLLQDQGNLAEAEPYYREALDKSRRVLGEEHPITLIFINNIASLLHDQGKLDQAEPYFREALEKSRRVLGEEHPDTLVSINNMGFLLQAQGKLTEAEPYHREALENCRRLLGEEHPNTLNAMNIMGDLLESQNKLAEAELYYREALEKRRRVLGGVHPETLRSINNMGVLLWETGKLAEAEPYFQEALASRRRVLGEEHPSTLTSKVNMGSLLRAQGKYQEAINLLVPAESVARKTLVGGNARRLADFLTTLARARTGLGYDPDRFKLAEANLLEAYAIYLAAKDRGPTHKDTLECVQGLIDLYTAWHTAEPGKGYDAKAAEWQAKLDAAKAPTAPTTPPPPAPSPPK